MRHLTFIAALACLLMASCRTTRKAEREVSRYEVDSASTVAAVTATEDVAAEIRIDSVILRRDTAGAVTVSARGIKTRRFERRAASAVAARDTVSRRAVAASRTEANARPALPGFPAPAIALLSACILIVVMLKWKHKETP